MRRGRIDHHRFIALRPMATLPVTVGVAVALALLGAALVVWSWTSGSAAARYDDGTAVGCDPAIDAALQAWVDAGFAGSVAVRGGERECVAGYGMADEAAGRQITPETAFDIASVSKAVTAAAVLDLVDRGELALDDPIGKHVDGLTGPIAEVELRDLLLHSSGLVGAYHGHDHEALSRAEAVEAISSIEIGFEPGSQYLYSNSNYTLLALAIEEVTGSFRDFVSTSILVNGDGEPIGGFWDGEPATAEPRAVGYLTGDGKEGHRGGFAGPHWALDGNGGIGMTPSELAEWTRALFSGEILSDRAVDLLLSTTSHLAPGDAVELPGWGRLDREVLGAKAILTSGAGDAIGQVMDVAWLPDTEEVLVLAQSHGSWRTGSIAEDVLLRMALGTGVPPPPEVAEPDPAALAVLVGTHELGDGARLRISRDGPGVTVMAEGAQAIAALFPVPPGFEAEIERLEGEAIAFFDGSTPAGRRERERLERHNRSIENVELVGTIGGDGSSTFFEVEFEGDADGSDPTLVVVSLNRYGGNEGVGVTSWPSAVFVTDGSGALVRYGAGPTDRQVRLVPTADGLQIDGPDGAVLLERS